MLERFKLKHGEGVAPATERVTVTDVIITKAQAAAIIMLFKLPQHLAVSTLYVQAAEEIVVVLNVLDVMAALVMLPDLV
jgi:hypothetical protein